MKVCTKCKVPKDEGDFRVRNRNGKTFLNPTCKKCDVAYSKRYLELNPKTPEQVKRDTATKSEWAKRNKESVEASKNKYYQTSKYRNVKNDWRNNNIDKANRNISELHDCYIIGLLVDNTPLKPSDIRNHPNAVELIEFKRSQLKLQRTCKSQKEQNPRRTTQS